MAQNHPGPPPGRGSGRIPVLSTTLRREGLRSGGPPEPATEVQPPRMVIRVPPRPANGETTVVPNTARPVNRENPVIPNTARPANRETPIVSNPVRATNRETPVAPNTARNDTREVAPPSYTEQVGQEATGTPRTERVSADEGSLSEPGTGTQSNQELGGSSTSSENLATTETTVIERDVTEPQNVRIALDREIIETIRGIAREQRDLRGEIQGTRQDQRNLRSEILGARQDTANLQATAKTHESRLGLLFKRIGDVIDDQWAVREGMDELRRTYETRVPARSPIKSEPRSMTNNGDRSSISTPEPIAMPRSDIESLYASEEDNREVVPENAGGWAEVETQQRDQRETPGEAWIRTRNQPQRFGLGTEEVLERWRAASEASREQRAVRRLRRNGNQQQRDVGARSTEDRGDGGEQRRSVTQPHEVGFGRHPNPSTPPQANPQPSNHGHQDPGDGSSSGDEPGRGGGGLNHPPRRRSSHAGDDSRDGSRTNHGRSR